jgi:D-aspartate ligase
MKPASKSSNAIVIGGDYRGLGLVRSLGRRGIPVCVITDEHTIASFSRYAVQTLPWPTVPGDRLGFLLELGAKSSLRGSMLFPTTDETAALPALNHRSLAEKFVLTTPPWDKLQWAYDKRLTYCLAAELDVAYPKTMYPRNREDVEFFDLSFPVILKPATKHAPSRFTREKAWRVENRKQAVGRYEEACEMIERSAIMLQDLIPGDGSQQFSYGALCDEGLPLASIVARRRRQFPLDFGHSSSYVESIDKSNGWRAS